jgi:hypothetical protein
VVFSEDFDSSKSVASPIKLYSVVILLAWLFNYFGGFVDNNSYFLSPTIQYRSARENSCLDRFLLVTQSANRICHDMFPATQEGVQSCLMHVYSAKRNPSPIEDAEIHEACESRGFNEVYHFATVFLCM